MNIINKVEELKQKVNELQTAINELLNAIRKLIGNNGIHAESISTTSYKVELRYDDGIFTVSEAEAMEYVPPAYQAPALPPLSDK